MGEFGVFPIFPSVLIGFIFHPFLILYFYLHYLGCFIALGVSVEGCVVVFCS